MELHIPDQIRPDSDNRNSKPSTSRTYTAEEPCCIKTGNNVEINCSNQPKTANSTEVSLNVSSMSFSEMIPLPKKKTSKGKNGGKKAKTTFRGTNLYSNENRFRREGCKENGKKAKN